MPRLYAIGDIHGHLDALKAAHARIAADGGAEAMVVHLGDLIDRGPDSAGVIAYLAEGQADGRDWITVMGNHDRFLVRFLADPDWIDGALSKPQHWLDHPGLGAAATVASYGVDPARPRAEVHRDLVRAVPRDHARWLAGLPRWHLTPQALFVHAGVRAGVDLSAQTEDDLLWIRRGFLDATSSFGPLVVHGHTPEGARPVHHGNRLNIDTGAAYGGPLSAVVIEAGGVWLLGETGREGVAPPESAGLAPTP